jgi:hypothetical protein
MHEQQHCADQAHQYAELGNRIHVSAHRENVMISGRITQQTDFLI